MKGLWALASLIYCLTVDAQSLLVVQSATVHDLYGNSIVAQLLAVEREPHIFVFNARRFTYDTSAYSRESLKRVLKAAVERSKPSLILYLGEPEFDTGFPSKYSSVLIGADNFNTAALRAASSYNEKWAKTYIVTDSSALATLRLTELKTRLEGLDVEIHIVNTVLEYRKLLLDLQKEAVGTIVMNVFGLKDEWNNTVGYAELEKIMVATNRRHIDVGICRSGFKTALAVGPTPKEAASLAIASYNKPLNLHISSCANLSRLKSKPSWLSLYRKSMGKFDIVEGG